MQSQLRDLALCEDSHARKTFNDIIAVLKTENPSQSYRVLNFFDTFLELKIEFFLLLKRFSIDNLIRNYPGITEIKRNDTI